MKERRCEEDKKPDKQYYEKVDDLPGEDKVESEEGEEDLEGSHLSLGYNPCSAR